MSNNPTYRQQFDKLTTSYIENRVNPFQDCACFVGNLLNGKGRWGSCRYWGAEGGIEDHLERTKFSSLNDINEILLMECNSFYTPDEILSIERLFLGTYKDSGGDREFLYNGNFNEDALFKAFEVTLDYLKQIHISKGEVIDETPVFQKRQLKTV